MPPVPVPNIYIFKKRVEDRLNVRVMNNTISSQHKRPFLDQCLLIKYIFLCGSVFVFVALFLQMGEQDAACIGRESGLDLARCLPDVRGGQNAERIRC